jgi:hypothetical protein
MSSSHKQALSVANVNDLESQPEDLESVKQDEFELKIKRVASIRQSANTKEANLSEQNILKLTNQMNLQSNEALINMTDSN